MEKGERPMGKPLAVFGLVCAALALLGIFAYTQLEVYPRTRRIEPAREVRGNEYLAMERWLRQTGHSLRTESWGDPSTILAASEGTAFIQSSHFYWPAEAWDLLFPWIEAGGLLIIALDAPWYEEADEGLLLFLNRLGIARIDGEHQSSPSAYPGDPDFDRETALDLSDTPSGEMLILKDHGGAIRLIRTSLGRGSVTVTGTPYFMQNFPLGKHQNAATAWNLFAAGASGAAGENPGILFIRGREIQRSFWGKLADRGNFTFLIVSIPLVIVVGFWMVLPGFGIILKEEEEPLRSIRERFLAEGRFFKKYGALDTYLEVYVREIRFRLQRRDGGGGEESPEVLAARIHKIGEGKDRPGFPLPDLQTLTEVLRTGKRRGYREFVKNLIILETVLEYI
ncbi:MAG: DUF4350 domain-containing protein [Treponema sp.]|jgi:hypothetical protein|nr:DUF4350 domain-containing protein [Treponema sp.]